GLGDGKFVLDEKNAAAVACLFSRDVGERVMERVLTIKAAEERHRGRVQHVAVEEIFHERVEEADHEERGGRLPPRSEELLVPHAGREEPERREQARERDENGYEKKRERKLLV